MQLLLNVGFLGALLGTTLILVFAAAVIWIFVRLIFRQKDYAAWAALIAPICATWIIYSGAHLLQGSLKSQETGAAMSQLDIQRRQTEQQINPNENPWAIQSKQTEQQISPTAPVIKSKLDFPKIPGETKPQLTDSERRSCFELLPPDTQMKCFQ